MRIAFAFAFLLVLVTLPTAAFADGGADAEVDALLAGYEFVPTAADWRRVGDDAAPILMKRAGEAGRDLLDRARAVSSLAHFPTTAVRAWLTALVADASAPDVLRRKATAALVHAFPPATAPKPAQAPIPTPSVGP